MGVRIWGTGLVAAAVITAVTASAAPASQIPAAPPLWAPTQDLPASLADTTVAGTQKTKPDALTGKWPCSLPMRIYYAASMSTDSRSLVKQLEYPVRYLRDLGYDVKLAREVAYSVGYTVPTTPGDVLIVAPRKQDDLGYVSSHDLLAIAEAPAARGVIRSAKITIDANRALASDVLLHEIGHALGLKHKPDTVMAESATTSVAFDPAETAAIDCR